MSVATAHVEQMPAVRTELFVGGSWRAAADGATLSVIDPATEESLVEIAAAGQRDVDEAVALARAQVDGGPWSRLTGAERGRLLTGLAELVRRDTELLARLEALDVGRPIAEPRTVDVPQAADTFEHFAGWADKIEGRVVDALPVAGRRRHAYTRREPVGVVGAIIPWNAPTMIAAWKLAPALAAGCAVVLKPSEDAPLAPLHLAALIEQAGFPAGVVSVLPGTGPVAGAALVEHPGVDKLSFTGSPEVGREVAVSAARAVRPVALELGGKSPQVVLPDADVADAIAGIAIGLFANQGQVCAAGTRVFVARERYEEIVDGLAEAATQVRLGDPLDETTTMGALVNRAQLERVTGYIDHGIGEGARLVTGGTRPDGPGYFVPPTVFADGTNDMRIAREEIFGPVGTVIRYDDLDEAVRLANDTVYGLAAYVWTRDVSRAHELAAQLRAGTVWVNGVGPPDPRLPWGGIKASGIGRELGWAGIEANTEEKVVSIVL